MRLAERPRRGHQLVVRDDLRHQADAQRLRRVDDVAGVAQLGRLGRTDGARQSPQAAEVGDETALHEQLAEASPLGGDADVREQRGGPFPSRPPDR